MSILELEHVKKSYPLPEGGGRRTVLDIEHFTLGEGEDMALEGASGSGKTTLLHCCAGITRPDQGHVFLGGRDLSVLPESGLDAARGGSLGYVFQTFNLLQGLSALENVELALRLGAGFEPGRALTLLKRVGLEEHAGHLPSHLSAGQQQRVAVARALANRPGLVLADEPTGNLDPASAEAVLELLRETCAEAGAALLLVSHDPSVLRRFKRRLSLESINLAGPKPKRPRAGNGARP